MATYDEKALQATWRAWASQPGNKKLSSEVIAKFDPLIKVVINSYLGKQYVNDPLMIGRARQLLYQSLQTYSPEKGPITSYVWMNLQRLQRYLNKQQNVIRLSERDALIARAVENAEKEFIEEMGREPTDEELADKLNISRARLLKLRRRQKMGFEGSFEAVGDDETGGMLPGVDTAGRPINRKYAELLYDSLEDTKDKYIMERAFGLGNREPVPLDKIAKDLNISKGAVSQRLAKLNQQLLELSEALR